MRSVYEYGSVKLLYEISQEIVPFLKEAFADEYNEILAMAIVKVIQPVPIKLIKSVRRNFKIIDYGIDMQGSFVYRKRG